MRNVLIINTTGLGREGITTVIYNYCACIKGVSLSFVAQKGVDKDLKSEFSLLGEVIELSNRRDDFKKYIKELNVLLKNKTYDVIHIHGNSSTMTIEALFARLHDVKQIIVHCHNTTCSHPIVNSILRLPMIKLSTVRLACSSEAGDWLYGKSKYMVLNNAINTNRFRFSEIVRKQTRTKLLIDDSTYVIGHVGRFNEQKNQEFLIDVFVQFHKKVANSVLLLVGAGEKLAQIKNKVQELKIEKSVIFVEPTNQPEMYYQCMDTFLFPSKYEGLGLVLVEAQASGLPCIASTGVPREANASGTVYFEELIKEAWVDRAVDFYLSSSDNRLGVSLNNIIRIKNAGFDIDNEVSRLANIYNSK